MRGGLRDKRGAIPVLLRECACRVELVRGAGGVFPELVHLHDARVRKNVVPIGNVRQHRVSQTRASVVAQRDVHELRWTTVGCGA